MIRAKNIDIWIGGNGEAVQRFFHRHPYNENTLEERKINYMVLADRQLYFFLYEKDSGNVLAAAGLEKSPYSDNLCWLMFLDDHIDHKEKGYSARLATEVFSFCRNAHIKVQASTYTEQEEAVLPAILREAAISTKITFLESGHHSKNSSNGPFVWSLSPNHQLSQYYIEKISERGAEIPQRVFSEPTETATIAIRLPSFLVRQNGGDNYLASSIVPELVNVLTMPEKTSPRP